MTIHPGPVTIDDIINELSGVRFMITNEKDVQKQLFEKLAVRFYACNHMDREIRLGQLGIIDMLIEDTGIEVKLKGTAKQIYYQCERYCKSDQLNSLLLITNKRMTLPPTIEGKICKVFNLSMAWL
jgi:hypothetical protein